MPEIAIATKTAVAKFCNDTRAVVIWIDWYRYHVDRFQALLESETKSGQVTGLELVSGNGVHAGYQFRENLPSCQSIRTLFPGAGWHEVSGLQMARAVWSRLSSLKPNLLLIPGYYTWPGLAAAIWGKLHRCTTVLMTETTGHDHKRTWWKESFKGLLIRSLFDWAIAGGTAHRRYLAQLGFRQDRIARFYDVVGNHFYAQQTRALQRYSTAADFSLPQNFFLYVGRLAEEKNVNALIIAFARYRESGGTWSLVLVGDGPERERLQSLASSSGYGEYIRFEGIKKSTDLPAYYAFAGCFVLPSSREPWGLVVNEAMASGLPVIVSRRCGCAEDLVEEDENGFLFDPASQTELAACLSSLAASTREKLSAMGQRSLEIISQFSPEAWAAEVVRIAESKSL